MAPNGRAEINSWEIWLKIHFNNCLIGSCVRLYFIFYIYICIILPVGTGFKQRINISRAQKITETCLHYLAFLHLIFLLLRVSPFFETESAVNSTTHTSAISRVFLVVCLHEEGHRLFNYPKCHFTPLHNHITSQITGYFYVSGNPVAESEQVWPVTQPR